MGRKWSGWGGVWDGGRGWRQRAGLDDDQWPGAPDSCRKYGILWLQGDSALLVPLYGAFLSWARAFGEKSRASHPIQVLSAGSGGLERAG